MAEPVQGTRWRCCWCRCVATAASASAPLGSRSSQRGNRHPPPDAVPRLQATTCPPDQGHRVAAQVEMALIRAPSSRRARLQQEIQRCPRTTTPRQRPATAVSNRSPSCTNTLSTQSRTCSAQPHHPGTAGRASHQPSGQLNRCSSRSHCRPLARSAAHAWPSPAMGRSPGFIEKTPAWTEPERRQQARRSRRGDCETFQSTPIDRPAGVHSPADAVMPHR